MNYELTPDLYSKQTMVLEDLLDHHPDFHPRHDPTFSPEDVEIFDQVFFPDWDLQEGYQATFHALFDANPELIQRSQALLDRFLAAHSVDVGDLLQKV